MAETIINAQGFVPTGGLDAIYTCPSLTEADITSIVVTNKTLPFTIEIQKIISGFDGVTIFSFTLDAGDQHIHNAPVNLKNGQSLLAVSSAEGTEFIVEGKETS